MNRKTMMATLAGVLIVALIAVFTPAGAQAARLLTGRDIKNGSLFSRDIHDNTVKSRDIKDGTVTDADLAPGTVTNGEDGAKGDKGDKGADGVGTPGPPGPPGPAASDVFGEAVSAGTSGLVSIANIGGPYATNSTTLFTMDLPEAGTYLLSANGYFDRLNDNEAGYEAPPTATYLQLTVRGAGNGATCFTPAVSPRGFTETTCDASGVVTVSEATTLTVRGFGYNEDRSGFGGTPNSAMPQFKVAAQLTAVRVG